MYTVFLAQIFMNSINQIEGHKFISYYNYSMPPSLNKVYYYH